MDHAGRRNDEALLRALDEWAGLLEAVVRVPCGQAAAMLLLRYIVVVADELHATRSVRNYEGSHLLRRRWP